MRGGVCVAQTANGAILTVIGGLPAESMSYSFKSEHVAAGSLGYLTHFRFVWRWLKTLLQPGWPHHSISAALGFARAALATLR